MLKSYRLETKHHSIEVISYEHTVNNNWRETIKILVTWLNCETCQGSCFFHIYLLNWFVSAFDNLYISRFLFLSYLSIKLVLIHIWQNFFNTLLIHLVNTFWKCGILAQQGVDNNNTEDTCFVLFCTICVFQCKIKIYFTEWTSHAIFSWVAQPQVKI